MLIMATQKSVIKERSTQKLYSFEVSTQGGSINSNVFDTVRSMTIIGGLVSIYSPACIDGTENAASSSVARTFISSRGALNRSLKLAALCFPWSSNIKD